MLCTAYFLPHGITYCVFYFNYYSVDFVFIYHPVLYFYLKIKKIKSTVSGARKKPNVCPTVNWAVDTPKVGSQKSSTVTNSKTDMTTLMWSPSLVFT